MRIKIKSENCKYWKYGQCRKKAYECFYAHGLDDRKKYQAKELYGPEICLNVGKIIKKKDKII